MYSKDLKEKICQARMMGQSWGTISVNFNVPKSSCCKIVKNIGAQRPLSKKPNLKVTGNVKKRLILAIQNMKETNARITASSLIEKSNIRLSKSTVQRFLKNEGFKYMNSKKEIVRTQKHKNDRKEICQKWLIAGTSSKNIVFTDETRYNLDGPDNDMSWQQTTCRRKQPRRQQGGGGIMIWGMLLPSGKLCYVEVCGTLNSAKYIKILSEFALPIINLLLDDNFLLQQDNAPAHMSSATQLFLESKGVELLGWPSKSPDLNVIENVWQLLANRIYRNGAVRNVMDLREKIDEAVTEFNEQSNHGRSIYHSFGKRILECYERSGNLVKV